MKTPLLQEPVKETSRPLVLYHCGHEQCSPSHSFGPAIRPHYLLHYILRGQGSYYVNGKVCHIKGGEGFLICPGVTTLYRADDKDPWEYCWIGFDGWDVSLILKSCGLSMSEPVFSTEEKDCLWKDFQELIHCFEEREGNEYTYISYLYRCFSRIYIKDSISPEYVHDSHLAKALDYIHNNYSYDISIADLAKHLSIDRTYLFKLFKAKLTISTQQYLIRYRLEVSQKLLRETTLSVTEIAYSCGFKDSSSFDKHFKKAFHMTPLQYRSNKSIVT